MRHFCVILQADMKIELSGTYGYRRMIRSSLPSILMMLATSVYSIVDGLFVSNFTGTTPFAALNLIWPAIMITGAIGLMFGTGGSTGTRRPNLTGTPCDNAAH